ncbi:hypothetical protein AAC387_Pa03g0863 [Persea americana]
MPPAKRKMVHLLSKTLLQNPIKQRLSTHLLQNPSLKTLSQPTPPTHLIQYLTDSCHLSPESALSAAKKFRGKIPQNPDSILTLLKDHGFSKTHIQNLVSKRPKILFFRVKSNLIPKMEFFKATGLPAPVIAEYLSSTPVILFYSLDNRIKPVFDLIRSVSSTHEVFAKMPRHSNCLFRYSLDKFIVPNVTLLQNYSVPNDRIYNMFMANPRVLTLNSYRFGENVRLVNEMGFNPSSHGFMEAVRAMGTLSRATWKAKFEVYRSMGWSDEEILYAFRKHPCLMTISEEKIRKGMSFFCEELDWGVSVVSRCPVVLSLSLEKRIVPRHKVWQVLKSRGLVKDSIPLKPFLVSEKQFLKEYVLRRSEMVPQLLKVYHGEIGCTPPVTGHRGK